MTLVVDTRPSDFSSVQRPLIYEISTDKFPNTITNENGAVIADLREVLAADVVSFPDFKLGELMLIPTAPVSIIPGKFVKGQHILIKNTDDGLYDGVQQIKRVGSTAAFVLNTAFIGDDTGGTFDKFYNNLILNVRVFADGVEQTTAYRPRMTSDEKFTAGIAGLMRTLVSPQKKDLDNGVTGGAETTLHKEYYIKYDERFDEPDADGFNSQTKGLVIDDVANTKIALFGVTQYIKRRGTIVDYNIQLEWTPFVKTNSNTDVRFLTNMPKRVRVSRTSSMQVDWIVNNDTFTPVQYRTVKRFDNTGAEIGPPDRDIWDPTDGNTQQSGVGPVNLGVFVTVPTVQLQISLEEDDGIGGYDTVSEIITLDIDDAPCRFEQEFYFLNELSGYDQATFTGTVQEDSKIERGTTKRFLPAVPIIGDRQFVDHSNKRADVFTSTTKWISKEQSQWLTELAQSQDAFTVEEGLAEYIPITILSNSTPGFNSQDNLVTFEIEWRYAFDQIVPT